MGGEPQESWHPYLGLRAQPSTLQHLWVAQHKGWPLHRGQSRRGSKTASPESPDSSLNASCLHMSEESKISMLSVRQSKTHPNKELTLRKQTLREQERTLKQILSPQGESCPPIEEPELSSARWLWGRRKRLYGRPGVTPSSLPYWLCDLIQLL